MVLADGGQFLAPAEPGRDFCSATSAASSGISAAATGSITSMHVYGGVNASSRSSCWCCSRFISRSITESSAAARPVARTPQWLQPARLGVRAFPWVAVELARTYITGFPWDLLGTTQIDNIPLARIATVTGVYGVSFEIALVNAAVAAAFLVPQRTAMLLLTVCAVAVTLHAGKLVHQRRFRPTRRDAGAIEHSHPRRLMRWTLDEPAEHCSTSCRR